MKRQQHWIAGCILSWLAISLGFAQESASPSRYRLDLTKDFISWVWSADVQTVINTGQKSRLTVSNQLRSSLLRQAAQTDKWRDENTLALYWEQPLSARFATRSVVESRIFSDENAGREFNKHLLAQELTIQAHPHIQLKPALGMTFEESFDTADEGWYARMGLAVSKLNMSEYLNYTDASSVIRAFPGRKNQEHTFFTGWTRQFSDRAGDSLRLGYQFSENQYYLQPTPEFPDAQEKVAINARFLFNQLQYQVSESAVLAFLTQLKDRDIEQFNPFGSRRREELVLENQVQYLMYMGHWQLRNSFLFSQASNNNPGVDTDITTLQSAFNTQLRYRAGRNNLWGKFSFTKLEYNTPSEESAGGSSLNNRQDRDELRFIFDTGYRRRLSTYFSAGLHGNVYLFHQIYLRAGRSQNNNWNRIYQIGATFDHRISASVRHGQQLKILANYTAYDFESLLPQVRSFVFRKLVYNDSLGLDLSDRLTLSSIYQWEKEDNGTFFQNQFAQLVNRELSAHFLSVSLQHRDVYGLKVTAGVSMFFRDEWGFTPERVRRQVRRFRSVSPRLTVIYPASKRLLLYLNYAPNRSENFTRAVGDIDFQENIQYFTSGNINLRFTF